MTLVLSYAALRRAFRFMVVCGCVHPLARALPQHKQIAPPAVLSLDASAPFTPPKPAAYKPGAARAPDGQRIGVTDRYLTRNGQPWLPVMGELHFSRVPAEEWEEEILKMKAAGVEVLSTYVIWIHHEEARGHWDWSGQRDLRRFATLCAKHHMLLFLRIGPWVHGETRNGGLPDWVMQASPVRETDPIFMAETAAYYQQIARQTDGLLWKEGGPVIGIQLDNEYVQRGPRQGEAYILALKKLAVDDGMEVPLYTVTGWGNAPAPRGEVLPVFGGYPDAPWGDARTILPPAEVYAFRFKDRASGNMGLLGANEPHPAQQSQIQSTTPFLTAEMGGGMQSTYHRRITVTAEDVAAMMPVLLGSGVNAYGTYMFHGGQNPEGVSSTLQESQQTGYPSDLPVKSYDFQSPIGEFGLERPSLRALKQWNYFLNDFGGILAPMLPFHPDIMPTGPEDFQPVRWNVRSDSRGGFLFLNNYVREAKMPPRHQVQFSIKLPGNVTRLIPQTPIDIPEGAYFAWPFGIDLAELPIRYATAQPLMTWNDRPNGRTTTLVFACLPRMRCELALEGSGRRVEPDQGVTVHRHDGVTMLTADMSGIVQATGLRRSAVVRGADGKSTSILFLTPEQALDAWKVELGGRAHLLETKATVFADDRNLTLLQLDVPDFSFALYPAPSTAIKGSTAFKAEGNGTFAANVSRASFPMEATLKRPARIAPEVHFGPRSRTPQLPDDAVWDAVEGQWGLQSAETSLPATVHDLFLKIDYTGDSARLRTHRRLLADEFYAGEPWIVGLRRYLTAGRIPPLELDILPFRGDSPVYVPAAARQRVEAAGQTIRLDHIELLPEYKLRIDTSTESIGKHD